MERRLLWLYSFSLLIQGNHRSLIGGEALTQYFRRRASQISGSLASFLALSNPLLRQSAVGGGRQRHRNGRHPLALGTFCWCPPFLVPSYLL